MTPKSAPPFWPPSASDAAEIHARHAVEYLTRSMDALEVAWESEGVRLDVDSLEVREWLASVLTRRLVSTARGAT